MSYGASAALQKAVYDKLFALPAPVYDAVPPGEVPPVYISVGLETVRDASDKTCRGAVHQFTVSVLSVNSSFLKAKEIAAEACDALVDAELTLARGQLVSISFVRAQAIRIRDGAGRQINLRFRARTEDN